jgi:APA family basic amino acid/polyamine antiporter
LNTSIGQATDGAATRQADTQPQLLRRLGAWDVALITFGTLVGSAIFLAAGIVPREIPQPAIMMALWALGGLLSIAGVLTYAELGAMFPEAGGAYHYLKAAYGPLVGFLFGWSAFLVTQTGAIAFLAVASSERLAYFLPFLSPENVIFTLPLGVTSLAITGSKVGAALAIVFLCAVNYVGLRQGAGLQNAITIVKIASLVALAGFGLAAPATAEPDWWGVPADVDWVHAIGLGMIGVLWCFDGFYQATFCGGEIRDPGRNLPRGMIMGLLLTLVLYLLVNLVYLRALPMDELGQASGIGEAAATALFGAGWAPLFTLAVFISIFGCLASGVLTSSRIYLPMAQDGLFFRRLAKIHPVYRTPSACIVALGIWSIVLAFSGSYEQLGTYVIFAVFLFHAATGAAVIVLRRKLPERARPYRTWGYPWTPIVFILVSLAFVMNTLVERPVQSVWGLVLVALGLPAYAWWRRGVGVLRRHGAAEPPS